MSVDPVHRSLGEGEDAEEEERHYRAEDGPAPDRMRGDGVDFVGGAGADGAVADDDIGDDPADGVVARADEGAGPIGAGGRPTVLPGAKQIGGAGVQG